jgi:hypothetical protein
VRVVLDIDANGLLNIVVEETATDTQARTVVTSDKVL